MIIRIGLGLFLGYFLYMLSACSSPSSSGSASRSSSSQNYLYFAYIANKGAGTISAFSYTTSGSFTAVPGSPFSVGAAPTAMAVARSGKYLYALNYTSQSISGFSIHPQTGALTAVSGSPFANGAGTSPVSLAIDPAEKFLYVANSLSGTVSVYPINSATGALGAQIAGSPFATSGTPQSIAMDSTGQFLYVASSVTNSISLHSVNSVTGILSTPPVISLIGGSPVALAADPTGKFLFLGSASSSYSSFNINAGTGTISTAAGAPYASACNNYGAAVGGGGKYLYLAQATCATLAAVSINTTTGTLSHIQGSVNLVTFPTATTTYGVAVDASDTFVFASNWSGSSFSVYTINTSDGSLSQISGSPISVGTNPLAMTSIGILQ